MVGIPSLGAGGSADFETYDAFHPDIEPSPGAFLDGEDVLDGRDHALTHRLARQLFERRGVYDVTFGYNLARLNLDPRHPDAGFRYAVETADPTTLRAEFTPTTEFCPQSQALTRAAFRAWNGLDDRHEYDLVRVRVAEMHHRAVAINGQLQQLEERYLDTGDLEAVETEAPEAPPPPDAPF
jgi:hypothetical protein